MSSHSVFHTESVMTMDLQVLHVALRAAINFGPAKLRIVGTRSLGTCCTTISKTFKCISSSLVAHIFEQPEKTERAVLKEEQDSGDVNAGGDAEERSLWHGDCLFRNRRWYCSFELQLSTFLPFLRKTNLLNIGQKIIDRNGLIRQYCTSSRMDFVNKICSSSLDILTKSWFVCKKNFNFSFVGNHPFSRKAINGWLDAKNSKMEQLPQWESSTTIYFN